MGRSTKIRKWIIIHNIGMLIRISLLSRPSQCRIVGDVVELAREFAAGLPAQVADRAAGAHGGGSRWAKGKREG